MSIIKEIYTPQEELTFALESLTSVMTAALDGVANIPAKLMESFPNLLRGFSCNEDLSKLPQLLVTTKEEGKFLEHIKHISYLELRELKAYVPEGLVVTYLDYITALKPVVAQLQRIIPDVLDPYAHFLAILVSNPKEALATNTGLDHALMDLKRKEAYAAISACFSESHHLSETNVSAVIERNADWHIIFNELNVLLTGLKTVNRNAITILSKQCEDYLEIIYQNLKEHKLEALTAEVARSISHGALSVACEIEHWSVIYYRLLALEAMVAATVSKINSILD